MDIWEEATRADWLREKGFPEEFATIDAYTALVNDDYLTSCLIESVEDLVANLWGDVSSFYTEWKYRDRMLKLECSDYDTKNKLTMFLLGEGNMYKTPLLEYMNEARRYLPELPPCLYEERKPVDLIYHQTGFWGIIENFAIPIIIDDMRSNGIDAYYECDRENEDAWLVFEWDRDSPCPFSRS